MEKVILASKSPRRKELLSLMDIPFTVCVSNSEEYFDETKSIEDALLDVAKQKALAVQQEYPKETIISADTIVVYENLVLGKPKDENDAFSMLQMLSGKTHRVLTGVCILKEDKEEVFYEETMVTFYPLEESFIHDYIATKEPMDKAGAYGIQGRGSLLVEKIEGDYFNVVGLPIARVYRVMQSFLKQEAQYENK